PRTLRRTVQVRLGFESRGTAGWLPGGTLILFALASLRSVPTPLGRVPSYTVSRLQFMKHPG
ncbi:MAG: hypothetical protein JSU72_05680, partial [Deltaproteobacteria bacterium]